MHKKCSLIRTYSNNCFNERIANVIPDSASEFIQVNICSVVSPPYTVCKCLNVNVLYTELCKIVPIFFFCSFSSVRLMFFVDAFIAIRTVHVCVCSMRLTTSFRYSYNFCCVIHIAVPFSVLVFLKFANCVQCTQIFHSFSLSRSLIHFLCSMFAV